MHPHCQVIILEKSGKILSKVRVSGGGRCNVTNACFDHTQLPANYPRGEKQLKSAFSRFSVTDIIQWFERRSVKIKTEDDGRMFPDTDTSETIINCFLHEAEKSGIVVKLNTEVEDILRTQDGFMLQIKGGGEIECDKLLIATGGNPKADFYHWLKKIGHTIEKPVPSLFTFNIPANQITKLMGVSAPFVKIKIGKTNLESEGPLLITHWGMSGPAILKLSAWGARILNAMNYDFSIFINWIPVYNEEKLRAELAVLRLENSSRQMVSSRSLDLPKRLWEYILVKSGIEQNLKWADLSNKNMNHLINHLLRDEYKVAGKTTFKEEFVTCGGVSLKEVDFKTMQSKVVPDLYFAGEVLDIDGITGGFNFQNAWTTGYIAALEIGK